MIVRFQFDPNYLPAAIWWLENVNPMAVPETPPSSSPDKMLAIDPSGYVEIEFRDIGHHDNRAIVWNWSTSDDNQLA